MKMKKLFAIAVMMLGMVNTYAQVDGTFQFVDASGNVVADGSTVTFSEIEPGIPGLIADQIKFNLFVKNTLNEEAYVAARLVTEELPSGSVQFCFPEQCQNGELPKDYTSDGGTFSANEKRALNTEWNLENGKYGTARFTLQILVMDRSGKFPNYSYSKKANGPKITINCIYADPAGIADMESDKNATVISRYDSKGNKLSAPVKGLNIIRLSNGKTVKTIIK
ncbi:MAG: hypothetical protein J6C65_05190 [Prevotella sp.]|nr:hypothetical protein [Prevotella sp.]